MGLLLSSQPPTWGLVAVYGTACVLFLLLRTKTKEATR